MNLFEVMTGKISRMSHVNRYSSFPVNRRENVAEHSWWVGFIAYLIAMDLGAQGHGIDLAAVLEKALLHDISEVSSGDVIRSYKHSNEHIRDTMKEADQLNMERLLDGAEYEPIGAEIRLSWESSKKSLSGEIVSFADMAAVAFYCREEHRSGNRAILPVLQEAYETWFSKFHTHVLLGQYIDQMFPDGRFYDMIREVNLPAAKIFERPMMRDHSEGETAEYDSAAWPTREVPLG